MDGQAEPGPVDALQTCILKVPDAVQGDLLLLAAGEAATVHKALDRVRQYVASQLGEVDDSKHALLWVTGARLLCVRPMRA